MMILEAQVIEAAMQGIILPTSSHFALYTVPNVLLLFLFLSELLGSGPFIMTSRQRETIITNDCDRLILHESFCFHNPFPHSPNHSQTHSTSVYSLSLFVFLSIIRPSAFVLVQFVSFYMFLDNGFDGYRSNELRERKL
jgi:hypothetical protein